MIHPFSGWGSGWGIPRRWILNSSFTSLLNLLCHLLCFPSSSLRRRTCATTSCSSAVYFAGVAQLLATSASFLGLVGRGFFSSFGTGEQEAIDVSQCGEFALRRGVSPRNVLYARVSIRRASGISSYSNRRRLRRRGIRDCCSIGGQRPALLGRISRRLGLFPRSHCSRSDGLRRPYRVNSGKTRTLLGVKRLSLGVGVSSLGSLRRGGRDAILFAGVWGDDKGDS